MVSDDDRHGELNRANCPLDGAPTFLIEFILQWPSA